MLEIVYQDDYLVAINKPHGLLVHRSSIANDTSEFALQLLRDQLGKKVYPVHRIDRKTGGLLLFAFDKDTEIAMQKLFAQNQISKTYLALVRGYAPDEGEIDYPLRKENGTLQDAFTAYKALQRTEVEVPLGKHPTSRYTLIEVKPRTGRMHQIRKHMAHIFYPIIGDRTHGCNKQNKLFKERWGIETMFLHASSLAFSHPVTGQPVQITAAVRAEFEEVLKLLGINF
ncbi:pseudouridine synthase [Mucilaginibacter defluvii]|uniref:tRNA pseudouridine(65) synthase TruC n=1 Tax=Mucilaginibacter defluvii TaxID=1196019 RepID=A0ABP9G736_9SPHI